MIKRLIFAVLTIGTVICATGCGNRQVLDFTYTFDKAIISLPNGDVVEGKINSWKDFDDGDQIQVKLNNTTYLVHSENVVLISE